MGCGLAVDFSDGVFARGAERFDTNRLIVKAPGLLDSRWFRRRGDGASMATERLKIHILVMFHKSSKVIKIK